jgi:hypothetical protein
MTVPGYRDQPTEPWDPDAPVDPAEAEDFLRQCYLENPRLGPVEPRLAIVRAQIAATGSYVHTPDELGYGARMAWRNSSRLHRPAVLAQPGGPGPAPGPYRRRDLRAAGNAIWRPPAGPASGR